MPNFSAYSANALSFKEVFCEQHHPKSVPTDQCVLYFIEADFETQKMIEM